MKTKYLMAIGAAVALAAITSVVIVYQMSNMVSAVGMGTTGQQKGQNSPSNIQGYPNTGQDKGGIENVLGDGDGD